MATKVLSLFHSQCGARISRVRGVKPNGWYDSLLAVGRDIERRRVRCPRCRMMVRFLDLIPSVDDETFTPVVKQDESGLVGYGPGQDATPGAKL